MEITAQRLRTLRFERNLSQQELAKAIGIGYSTLQSYEQGAYRISEKNIKRFAAFFEVSEAYLLGKTDFRNGEEGSFVDTKIAAQEEPGTEGIEIATALEIVDKLEKLVQLYRDGTITEEEYLKIKKRIIG